jgi:hypothetical protein
MKKPKPWAETCLHTIHQSIWGKPGFRPRDMDRIKLPSPEHKEATTRIALSIFVDCSNVGIPFQEALLAIYLSGLQHGAALSREK